MSRFLHKFETARLALLGGLFFWAIPLRAEVPWTDGEQLTYLVNWGSITAAEALFTSAKDGANWTFNLDLKSKGLIETINPIRSQFTSKTMPEPWHSLEFNEDRSEGKKRKKNRTSIWMESLSGRYEDLLNKTTQDFKLPTERIDDTGSLLYAIRNQDWRKNPELFLTVSDGPKIKYGRAKWIGEATQAIGIWPKQKLLIVEAWPEDEKGDKLKGSLKLWITDDEKRVPLRADFEARFGVFQIDLVKTAILPAVEPKEK